MNSQKEPSSNSKADELVALEGKYILQTYKRLPVVMERGQGVRLYDTAGREYLDFVAGIAVDALGHSHPHWIKTLTEQANKLVHTANIVYSEPGILLAEKLSKLSSMDRVFYTNSGTESVEAAFKIARKWGKKKRGSECYKIVNFEKSFHGRTFGALSATSNAKYRDPFQPLLPGFIALPIGDLDLIEKTFDGSVCAIIVESVQGESGVWPIDAKFLQGLRRLCDEKNVLLIVDEIQTGIARTGKWFGYQHSGVLPDLITLAKGLGGGFPIGACLAKGEAAETLEAGEHGSTYAGNPLATAVALGVLEFIEKEDLVKKSKEVGDYLAAELAKLCGTISVLDHVRGLGLMRGLEFKEPIARTVVAKGLDCGVLLNATSDTTLRFVPPLIITREEIDIGLGRLAQAVVAATL